MRSLLGDGWQQQGGETGKSAQRRTTFLGRALYGKSATRSIFRGESSRCLHKKEKLERQNEAGHKEKKKGKQKTSRVITVIAKLEWQAGCGGKRGAKGLCRLPHLSVEQRNATHPGGGVWCNGSSIRAWNSAKQAKTVYTGRRKGQKRQRV